MKNIFLIGLILSMVGFGISCYMKTEHKIEAHITIDIRELETTASQIEDMVRTKKTKKPQSLFLPWQVSLVYSEEMQIKFMTPEVEKAIATRGERLDMLEEFMVRGCIGENNNGYVEYRPCQACSSDPGLMEKVNKLIKEENMDRKTIYEAIVLQNNLGQDKISLVEKVFSTVQRKNAPAGSFIQDDRGAWIKK